MTTTIDARSLKRNSTAQLEGDHIIDGDLPDNLVLHVNGSLKVNGRIAGSSLISTSGNLEFTDCGYHSALDADGFIKFSSLHSNCSVTGASIHGGDANDDCSITSTQGNIILGKTGLRTKIDSAGDVQFDDIHYKSQCTAEGKITFKNVGPQVTMQGSEIQGEKAEEACSLTSTAGDITLTKLGMRTSVNSAGNLDVKDIQYKSVCQAKGKVTFESAGENVEITGSSIHGDSIGGRGIIISKIGDVELDTAGVECNITSAGNLTVNTLRYKNEAVAAGKIRFTTANDNITLKGAEIHGGTIGDRAKLHSTKDSILLEKLGNFGNLQSAGDITITGSCGINTTAQCNGTNHSKDKTDPKAKEQQHSEQKSQEDNHSWGSNRNWDDNWGRYQSHQHRPHTGGHTGSSARSIGCGILFDPEKKRFIVPSRLNRDTNFSPLLSQLRDSGGASITPGIIKLKGEDMKVLYVDPLGSLALRETIEKTFKGYVKEFGQQEVS